MDTIGVISHEIPLTVDTVASSLVMNAEQMCIACNSDNGMLFVLFHHDKGPGSVTTVQVPVSSKGVVQRMWQNLVFRRLVVL